MHAIGCATLDRAASFVNLAAQGLSLRRMQLWAVGDCYDVIDVAGPSESAPAAIQQLEAACGACAPSELQLLSMLTAVLTPMHK